MNRATKTQLEKIVSQLETLRGQIEDIKTDEEGKRDNSFKFFCSGKFVFHACDNLGNAYNDIDGAIDSLNEIIES